jgi:prepilin peptidase CpaA
MLALIIYLTCLFVTLAVAVMAAWSDFKGLTIPNWHSGVIIASFFACYLLLWLLGDAAALGGILSHLVSALMIFAITVALFALKTMGAGDSKLSTALAFWFSISGLPAFLFYMTLIGGLIGVSAIAMHKWKPFKTAPAGSWVARAQAGENKVPYGIAIAAGALASFVKLGYFSGVILTLLNS